MPELISILDHDAVLEELVPADQLQQARRISRTPMVRLPTGPWTESEDAQRARGGYGLFVVEGTLIRRVGVGGRFGAELLGPGDLLRPWQYDGGDSHALPFESAWRIVSPTSLAVLDLAWAGRVAQWPQLGAELAGRALERSRRLVMGMAIVQQPRLDERLWLLFWDLADRFGRVHADGVHLDLPLTHEVLSYLAAARRPPVSSALSRLAADGKLRRTGGTWVLCGDPPGPELSGA